LSKNCKRNTDAQPRSRRPTGRTRGAQQRAGERGSDEIEDGYRSGGGSSPRAAGSGVDNTGIGYSGLGGLTTGYQNTALGRNSGNTITTGYNNTIAGWKAGATTLSKGNGNVLIGNSADVSSGADTNETVVGGGATGNGSNTVTLGNTSATGLFMGTTKVPTETSTTPTVGAGVCWKTTTTLGTCSAGTWPNCTTCI
jgi:hypothetical protein